MIPENTFQHRFIRFSADVLLLVEKLPKTQTGRHIADQLLRSGTSIGANVQEARSAESRADFIHKMQVALKELRETAYWLEMINCARLCDATTLVDLPSRCEELTAILAKSVITAKKNT
jgi:four helix bundle protein